MQISSGADAAATAGADGAAGPASQPRPISRPRLAPHVRLVYDQARQRHVLLTPETVTLLNGTGAAILELCDGERTIAEILAELRGRYGDVPSDEVWLFLCGLFATRSVEFSHG
jgi:pyrroloquinoline quinone biosynthesis protein D